MIARPQLDLLGVLPSQAATAAKATLGGAQARFDVALLQATKSLRDATPEGQALVLDPKVQAAFEATLQQLAQTPLDQLKTLARDKAGTQGVVDNAAQAAGLGAEQKSALVQLTAAALPRLVSAKEGMLSMGANAANDRGGAQPGPQGGTPALADVPADSIQSTATAKARRQEENQTTPTLSVLAAQALTPVIISPRTDDGSRAAGLVSLASAKSPAPGAPLGLAGQEAPSQAAPNAQPQGRVITISTQGDTEAPAPVSLAPQVEAAMQQGLSLPQAPEAQAAGPAVDTVPTQPQGGGRGQAGAVTTVASEPGVVEDPQVRFVPLTRAVAVEPDSVVTLKNTAPPAPTAAAPSAPATTAPPATLAAAPSTPATTAPPATLAAAPSAPATTAPPATLAAAPSAPATTAPPATLAAAQVAAAAATVPSAPSPLAAPLAPTTGGDGKAVAASNASAQPLGAEVAAAQAGNKSQEPAGPVGSLGQGAQDPLKALAQQVTQEAVVRQSSFQQVAQALQALPGTESGRLVISLKPSNLGDVTVDLVLSDGKLSARLIASSPAVHNAFVQDLAAFKAGLESHGVVVHEVSVGLQSGLNGQSQGQPQPQSQPDPGWWRSVPVPGQAPLPSASYGGSEWGADQRFSALA